MAMGNTVCSRIPGNSPELAAEDWVCKPKDFSQPPSDSFSDWLSSVQLWRYTVNCVQDGVTLLDQEYNLIDTNETVSCWYKDKEKLSGKKCFRVFHGRESRCRDCPVAKAFRDGRPACSDKDYSIHGREIGRQKIYAVPIFDKDGRICGAIEYIRDITLLEKIKSELQLVRDSLELLKSQNGSLRDLLRQKDLEHSQYDESIKNRIEKSILPSLQVLKQNAHSNALNEHVSFIESMIMQIEKPLGTGISSKFFNFTSRELQIAQLIKDGKSSKEIAAELFVSLKAVEFHRNNIRKKLGLTNNGKQHGSLRAYLLSL